MPEAACVEMILVVVSVMSRLVVVDAHVVVCCSGRDACIVDEGSLCPVDLLFMHEAVRDAKHATFNSTI